MILLLYAYPKNVMADLTPKQVARLAKVVKEARAIREKTSLSQSEFAHLMASV